MDNVLDFAILDLKSYHLYPHFPGSYFTINSFNIITNFWKKSAKEIIDNQSRRETVWLTTIKHISIFAIKSNFKIKQLKKAKSIELKNLIKHNV